MKITRQVGIVFAATMLLRTPVISIANRAEFSDKSWGARRSTTLTNLPERSVLLKLLDDNILPCAILLASRCPAVRLTKDDHRLISITGSNVKPKLGALRSDNCAGCDVTPCSQPSALLYGDKLKKSGSRV